MRTYRPKSVTWICNLAILATVVDALTLQMQLSAPRHAVWVKANAGTAQLQLFLSYGIATAFLVASYCMLLAKNWARWMYLGMSAVRYTVAVMLAGGEVVAQSQLVHAFRLSMVPGMVVFALSLWVLFRADARQYFADGGRPWWQIEEEMERKNEARGR